MQASKISACQPSCFSVTHRVRDYHESTQYLNFWEWGKYDLIAVFPSFLFTRSTSARVNRATTEDEKEKLQSVEYHAARHARMRSLSRQIGLRDITIVASLSLSCRWRARSVLCAAAFGKSDNLARQWARKVKRVCPSLECPFATQWLLPGCFSILFRRGGGRGGQDSP